MSDIHWTIKISNKISYGVKLTQKPVLDQLRIHEEENSTDVTYAEKKR